LYIFLNTTSALSENDKYYNILVCNIS